MTFAGIRLRTVATVTTPAMDGEHTLTVAEYRFPCGSIEIYVEATEVHAGVASEAKPFPLAEVCHLLINIGEDEFWRCVAREPRALAAGC